jgi:site-specific recombinase XerD
MAKRATKLTVYRRHAASCPKPKKLEGCDCPLWVHGKLRGKPVRESLGTRSATTALFKRDEMIRNPDDDGPNGGLAVMPKPSEITLEYAAQAFLKSKSRKSANTNTLYTLAVQHFTRYAQAHGLALLHQIDTPHIREYFDEFDKNWKRNTAQARLTMLRVFFNYCRKKRRWILFTPTEDPDLNYGAGGSSRVPFTPEEVTAILDAVERMPADVRDRARALIYVLLYTGMRISDATFFERDCLTASNVADYWVIKTKRPIGLPPEVQQAALDALAKLPPSRVYFFQPDQPDNYRKARAALRQGANRATVREGGEFCTLMPGYKSRIRVASKLVLKVLALAQLAGGCHRFRDTFATTMLTNKVDVFSVSQMLGHSDVKITIEHYMKLIPGYRERMSTATRALDYRVPQAAA